MHHRHRQRQALAHAQGSCRATAGTAARPKRCTISYARGNVGIGHVEQLRVQHQVLSARQLAVERERLRHVAHPPAGADVAGVHHLAKQARPGPSLAGSRPVSIFMVVDLPQPFEPKKAKISPAGCESSHGPPPRKSPKRMVRPSALMAISWRAFIRAAAESALAGDPGLFRAAVQ